VVTKNLKINTNLEVLIMALIKCPECGKEISDKTKKCPECGYPIKKLNKKSGTKRKIIISLIIVIGIIFIISITVIIIKLSNGKSTQQVEQQTQTEIVTETPLNDYEYAAINLVNKLKDRLKNPDSLKIYSLNVRQFYKGETTYHFCIDYSAQNGFGGNNRKTEYLEIGINDDLDKYAFDSMIMAMEQSNYTNNSNILDKSIDIDRIMNNLDKRK
jgi:ribosomal protein L37E